MKDWKFLKITLFTGLLVGCVGQPPIDDYVIANTAVLAARSSNAAKYAPGYFGYAEQYYRQGQNDYKDRNYESARANFSRAKQFAEKGENYTILKRAQTGESE